MTTSQEDSGYTSRQGAGAANSLPAPMIAYRSVMLLFVCKNGIWLKLKKYLFEVKKSICLKAQKVFVWKLKKYLIAPSQPRHRHLGSDGSDESGGEDSERGTEVNLKRKKLKSTQTKTKT